MKGGLRALAPAKSHQSGGKMKTLSLTAFGRILTMDGSAYVHGAAAHARLAVGGPEGEAGAALHALLACLAALGALVPGVRLAPARPACAALRLAPPRWSRRRPLHGNGALDSGQTVADPCWACNNSCVICKFLCYCKEACSVAWRVGCTQKRRTPARYLTGESLQ